MNRSWPFFAATSAAARALTSPIAMWSTVTFVSYFAAHSFVKTPSNHLSYPGTKWLHWMIFRVFCCAAARAGKRKLAPSPAAAAPAPVSFANWRRVMPVFALSVS